MKTASSQGGHRLTVYLPQPLYRRIKAEAKARKLTLGGIVRERLESGGNKPTGFDLLGDLIGSVKGGPVDLSTNPKWMEGFGEDIKRVKPRK